MSKIAQVTYWLLALGLILPLRTSQADPTFSVGAGIHDITGPAADLMMMGYVDLKQKTEGIHTRLRSRAFVIHDPRLDKRVALVTIDQLMVPDAVTTTVLEKLKARYGALYTQENVLISATHTHSAPGGFAHYTLYDLFTSGGHSKQNFDAIVGGIFASIVKAHNNLVPGRILIAEGEVQGVSNSRSADAYLLNPASERRLYPDNIDRKMTLLKFIAADGSPIGTLNWFAVHATSMKKTNRLISSDNKGYASLLFEGELGYRYQDSKGFVAAFANSNAGDVSSSSGGADADRNGDWVCALKDNFSCTEASGKSQYASARVLFAGATEEILGGIDYRHKFVDMSDVQVRTEFTGNGFGEQHTCFGAIGLSMLAGTKDGWGVGREKQTCSDPSLIGRALCVAHRCHGVKPVALATGNKNPYPWTPQILPIQLLRIGSLAIVAVPGEFTTMSGRRLRQTVERILREDGITRVVLAGYSNGYAGYVATREEYQMQNYEGASTHFGEWTLAAYQQEFSGLARAMFERRDSPPGPLPLDTRNKQSLPTAIAWAVDATPRGLNFGAIASDAEAAYSRGNTVRVQFWGANPNRDLHLQSSFLEVQREANGDWQPIAYDWDFETKFIWQKKGLGQSLITTEWAIPAGQVSGNYRILHRGVAEARQGNRQRYQGVSRTFRVR